MINKVTLIGRIGTKEFKETKNGSCICMLSVATNKNYRDSKGQKNETTTWHNVNFFSGLAEYCNKYAEIGDLIYIEGELANKKVKDHVIYSITGTTLKTLTKVRKEEI